MGEELTELHNVQPVNPEKGDKASFLDAVQRGDLESVQEAISTGDAMEVRATDESTPLVLAARSNHTHILKCLLESEGRATAQNACGDTALHWACFRGNTNAAELLLDHGADIEAIGDLGNRPLHLAASSGEPKVYGNIFKTLRGVACLAVQKTELCVVRNVKKDVIKYRFSTGLTHRLLAHTPLFQALASVRNQYGNDPLALTNNPACADMLRRVQSEGDKERSRLLAETSDQDTHKTGGHPDAQSPAVEEHSEEQNNEAAEVEAARKRRDAEDEEEDRIEREELERLRAEEEARRKEEEERLRAEEEARRKEEEEAMLAAAAKKKKKGKGKKK